MKRPTARRVALKVAKRLVHPRHTLEFLRCFTNHKGASKAVDDAQLKLYADILPGDFLNYGYFEDPAIPPERLSLHDIQRAHVLYAQTLIDLIADRQRPVLDAGCGMGGLLKLLVAQGFDPTALTPNRAQIQYITSRYPKLPLLPCKFEAVPLPKYRHAFGTVITSESFQYIDLAKGLAVMEEVLAPGGRWVLCDYFRTCETRRRSGHRWTDFTAALKERGWKRVSEQDITSNVLPLVGYVHMWGQRVGVPLAEFVVSKLRRKRPALHYLLDEVIEETKAYLLEQLNIVNPELFGREKRYMLLVIERA